MKSNSLFQQCLDMLQRDDIKTDLKLLMSPIMETLLFEIRPYLLSMEPEGVYKNHLYHWVLWTLFQCFLDIMPKTFFLKNHVYYVELDLISFIWNPKGDKKTPSITGCCGHFFNVFSTSCRKRFSLKTMSIMWH